MSVVPLFNGDPRLGEITERIKDKVYEQCKELPIPTVLGILDLVKDDVLQHVKEQP